MPATPRSVTPSLRPPAGRHRARALALVVTLAGIVVFTVAGLASAQGGGPPAQSTAVTEDNDRNDGATPNNVADDGDNAHPSGNDRSVEHGNAAANPNQGRSPADPDDDGRGPDRSNRGPDQPGGSGGADHADQDGNNGCGNDDDFEDDNEGRCGGRRGDAQAQPATGGPPAGTGGGNPGGGNADGGNQGGGNPGGGSPDGGNPGGEAVSGRGTDPGEADWSQNPPVNSGGLPTATVTITGGDGTPVGEAVAATTDPAPGGGPGGAGTTGDRGAVEVGAGSVGMPAGAAGVCPEAASAVQLLGSTVTLGTLALVAAGCLMLGALLPTMGMLVAGRAAARASAAASTA